MSAMMATNSLASRRGVFTPRCSRPAGASAAGAEHRLSPGISHLGLGLPLLPLPAGNAPLTERVADNASILEVLSSEATEEIYYL